MPSQPWWLLLLLLSAGCSAATESQRYRGDYTFGHEVNIFCPQINTQCYWLGPGTSQAMRAELKALYQAKTSGLYKPVCVVIEGFIDKDTPRSGFAADFDGLINITRLHGDCDTSAAGADKSIAAGTTMCEEPRSQACTRDYRPVCASLEDGSEKIYSNGCTACADAKVIVWVEGPCPD